MKKDMKTNLISTISDSVPLLVMTGFFGLFAGVWVTDTTGSLMLGLLAFVVVTIAPPGAKILFAVLNIKYGGIEYAATTERFVQYRETLTGTDVDAVPIERVRDAEYDEDFTDRIFGTGDIRIEGARGDSLYFNDAPNGDAVLRAVRQEIADAETVDVANPAAAGQASG